MGVAPKVAMGPLADVSISNLACNISNFMPILVLLSKSVQSIIDQLIRSTNIDVRKIGHLKA